MQNFITKWEKPAKETYDSLKVVIKNILQKLQKHTYFKSYVCSTQQSMLQLNEKSTRFQAVY